MLCNGGAGTASAFEKPGVTSDTPVLDKQCISDGLPANLCVQDNEHLNLLDGRIIDHDYAGHHGAYFLDGSHYATNSTTPPASLIFLSASRLKNLARTTMGISGIRPLPKTFEYPNGSRSRTGAVSPFSFDRYSSRLSTGTSDQSCKEGYEISFGF